MLQVSDLRVELGGETIVEAVSLQLEPHRCTRIAGPSGAGKSTALRALACLIPFVAKQLTLDRETPAAMGYPCWRRNVMYLPQRPVMFAGTVADNLRRAFGYAGIEREFEHSLAARLLGQLGLARLLDGQRAARDLSGGEQQRVQLVRALMLKPRILLLDEPTASLGKEHVPVVEQQLHDFCEDGGAAILVTHSDDQAARLAMDEIVLRVPADVAAARGTATTSGAV